VSAIVKYGDPVLATPCKPVDQFGPMLHDLIQHMWNALAETWTQRYRGALRGVALAAPQIGVPLRVSVVDLSCGMDPSVRVVLVNPQVVKSKGEQKEREGCLSIPNFWGAVKRPAYVEVEAQDELGTKYTVSGRGTLARAFCHEIDHLNGIVCLQHYAPGKRLETLKGIERLRAKGKF